MPLTTRYRTRFLSPSCQVNHDRSIVPREKSDNPDTGYGSPAVDKRRHRTSREPSSVRFPPPVARYRDRSRHTTSHTGSVSPLSFGEEMVRRRLGDTCVCVPRNSPCSLSAPADWATYSEYSEWTAGPTRPVSPLTAPSSTLFSAEMSKATSPRNSPSDMSSASQIEA